MFKSSKVPEISDPSFIVELSPAETQEILKKITIPNINKRYFLMLKPPKNKV